MATHAINDLATHAFELVNKELASTLDAARAQLEDYVDGRAGPDALLRTAEHLHTARGALKIVEIHGAALLAEEMEQTCRRLAEAKDEQKSEQGIEALTRAMVQLPAYLERVLGGGKDVALALLPLLNDLRQARDKPSLSEGTLVLLNSGPFERHLAPRAAGAGGADIGRGFEKVAQRLRPAFQAALLGWIKNAEPARSLDELLRVCANLERAAASEQVKQLWTVMTGVLTAIRGGGLEASVTLKRLIGQVDRQLKSSSTASSITSPRRIRRIRASRRCASSTTWARSCRGSYRSSRRVKGSPVPASSSCAPSRRRSKRTSAASRMPWTSSCAPA